MKPKRACIERVPISGGGTAGRPRYAVDGHRCEEHRLAKLRAREPSPSAKVAWTARWKRVRAAVIRKRRRPDGTWRCELCGGMIADAREIDLDHRAMVSAGGAPYDESTSPTAGAIGARVGWRKLMRVDAGWSRVRSAAG